MKDYSYQKKSGSGRQIEIHSEDQTKVTIRGIDDYCVEGQAMEDLLLTYCYLESSLHPWSPFNLDIVVPVTLVVWHVIIQNKTVIYNKNDFKKRKIIFRILT